MFNSNTSILTIYYYTFTFQQILHEPPNAPPAQVQTNSIGFILHCSLCEKRFVLSFTECAVGQFGVGCSQSCDCNGAPCDSVTGKCHCPAGQTGEHCEKGKKNSTLRSTKKKKIRNQRQIVVSLQVNRHIHFPKHVLNWSGIAFTWCFIWTKLNTLISAFSPCSAHV